MVSFACKGTDKIWQGGRSRKLPSDIQERALRKLRQLDVSANLEDLHIPSANHLEVLVGDRLGQYSIRFTKQWRLCFVWQNGNA
ncbi:type II toxin-antitoxin system RelE/ParE family toxin [Phormidium tenue]|uniref:Type II toxin-antitoxin system RelE/ParE family toxin n=1 Tax=Phormidium tenue FACHB-1050 TaxID=2692857 RepID=A0ABR8CI16_9CYAN|nr:type II toxin-antitoxin system RelE/ParE family toxin [Phormidium tenue]MBD2319680.1 type II toxin-antitoxin system RelE/ParE family toxin [Phormidium tenue FACHB-1050]